MATAELVVLPTPSSPSPIALDAAQRLVRLYPDLDPLAAVRLVEKGAVRA